MSTFRDVYDDKIFVSSGDNGRGATKVYITFSEKGGKEMDMILTPATAHELAAAILAAASGKCVTCGRMEER